MAQVKQLLRVYPSIKAMPIEQLFEHARAIVRDEAELGEQIVMAVQTAQNNYTNSPRLDSQARLNCFRCGWIGHIAKDCTVQRRTLLPMW